jgi:hypothetical protein
MQNLLIIAVVGLIAYNVCRLFGDLVLEACKAIGWFHKQRPIIVIPGTLAWAALVFYWIVR